VFSSKNCCTEWIRKNKPWHREDYSFDLNESLSAEEQDDEPETEKPSPITLADFLDQPTWDWLQWESDFVFVANQINENFSIDDYVFEEVGDDWTFC
jgi:hypothetical protein